MKPPALALALHARRVGAAWIAACPSHDDRNPSLSIRKKDGKVLVHCHAGCSQSDVVDALRARDLWPTEQKRAERRSRGPKRAQQCRDIVLSGPVAHSIVPQIARQTRRAHLNLILMTKIRAAMPRVDEVASRPPGAPFLPAP